MYSQVALTMQGNGGVLVMRGLWRVQRTVSKWTTPDVGPDPFDSAAVLLRSIWRSGAATSEIYPVYLYGVLCAERTARACAVERFSVAEMGVATGRGLLGLQEIARIVASRSGIGIDVVGFDTGEGLPPPTDPRDVPYGLATGDFRMDPSSLRARLAPTTQLILGDVAVTVPDYLETARSPLRFIANDLDYYTSTINSLRPLSELPAEQLLPRIALYFDDLLGYPYNRMNGEYAAIDEFNRLNGARIIAKVEGLRWRIGTPFNAQPWPEMFYVLENRDHPQFAVPEREHGRALVI